MIQTAASNLFFLMNYLEAVFSWHTHKTWRCRSRACTTVDSSHVQTQWRVLEPHVHGGPSANISSTAPSTSWKTLTFTLLAMQVFLNFSISW